MKKKTLMIIENNNNEIVINFLSGFKFGLNLTIYHNQ